MRTGKTERILILLFSAGAALSWAILLGWIVPAFQETKKICLLAVALLVCAFLCFRILKRLEDRPGLLPGISAVLFVLISTGLCYAGKELRVYPGWDFGSVYMGAVEIAEDGFFSGDSNWYFTTYPNNLAVCLFLGAIFKALGGLCSYITLGVLVNIFMIDLGLLCMYALAEELYGRAEACFSLLAAGLFLPFYMHTPIFYTDTFALPFVSGTLLLFVKRRRKTDGDVKPWMAAAAGVLAAVGFKMKGSLGVLLVAMLLFVWLEREKLTRKWQQSVLLLVPFLLVTGLITTVPRMLPIMDASDAEKNEFPLEHWLALGLTSSGGYNADVYFMTASVEGKAEKQAVDRAYVEEKLKEYGVSGMWTHLKEKEIFTWGDGVYFAPEKLKREPLKESWLHAYVLYDGARYASTYRYCNAYQLLLMLGILASFLKNFLKKGACRREVLLQLSVFGIFAFLLFWETRSRYLVNFVPVFILLGIDVLRSVGLQGTEKKRNEKA